MQWRINKRGLGGGAQHGEKSLTIYAEVVHGGAWHYGQTSRERQPHEQSEVGTATHIPNQLVGYAEALDGAVHSEPHGRRSALVTVPESRLPAIAKHSSTLWTP